MRRDDTNNSNVITCNRCNRTYVWEEYQSHQCRKLQIEVFDTDGNRWGSHDRITFFSLPPFPKLPTKMQQPNKTPDDCNTVKLLVVLSPGGCFLVVAKWVVNGDGVAATFVDTS